MRELRIDRRLRLTDRGRLVVALGLGVACAACVTIAAFASRAGDREAVNVAVMARIG